MNDDKSATRAPRRFLQITAAAAILLAASPAAKAEGLFTFFGGGPSPYEIERALGAAGYQLTGPLVRRGDVYLADVAVGRGGPERLVIDVETGRILERFRARRAPWSSPPAAGPEDPPQYDAWGAPVRPPAAIDRAGPGDSALDSLGSGPTARPPARVQIARGADRPVIIPGDAGALKEPKPKRIEVKHKPVTPATPAATAASVAPAAEPTPAVTPTPVAATSSTPMTNPPATPTAKDDASPNVVAAKSPAPDATPAPAPTPKAKALNDLPVTPLD